MGAEVLISQLESKGRVLQTGHGRWLACCPAHDDASPSLSIKELPDGRVLFHCFAGCSWGDILDSCGVHISEVSPPTDNYKPFMTKERERSFDEWVVGVGKGLIKEGTRLTEVQKKQVLEAQLRLCK